jgi:Fe-S cluster assembly protein SufD
MNALTPAKWHIDTLESLCQNDAIKEQAAEKLLALGLPNAKMEHYRYFGIVPLLSKNYRYVKQSVQPVEKSDAIEIVDGELVAAPEGVTVTMEQITTLEAEHYDPIYYISQMLTPKAIKISAKGTQNLKIRHRVTRTEALIACRLLIEVTPEAELTIDEIFEPNDAHDSLLLCGADVRVAKGAKLVWIRDQESHAKGAAMIASHAVQEEESAFVKLGTFDFGSSRILHNYYITLGDKAQIDAAHLLYGDGEGQRGNIVVIEHKGEHARTTQNAKHILKERARGIFDALIRVDHAGKYAVTHQNARSVLLDNGAYMVSKPQLEIYIDELEASHGSTTGQLDPAQLFYLQSRGIAREEAKKMLIYAFAKDVIETLGNEAIEKRLIEKFEKRYSGGVA